MDAIYIPSARYNKTGNVIVFAETTSYQDRLSHGLSRKYKYFLDCGADIVLWNPTVLQNKQYSQDLLSILKLLKERNPNQKIVVKAHCATVEPALAAASELSQTLTDNSVSLILDRGSASGLRLARSFTVLTKIALIRRIIKKQFSCEGSKKLKTFSGKIIFIAPKDLKADQVMYWKGKNFTYDMHECRKVNYFFHDLFIKLAEGSDHWSAWDATTYNAIAAELSNLGIVVNNYMKFKPFSTHYRRTFFKKNCISLLTKAWY